MSGPERTGEPAGTDAPGRCRRTGILLILSGPSGAGKTTLCDGIAGEPDLVYSVSCTTRPPRPGEIDGEDYSFLGEALFSERVAAGAFLEHATVHGHRYGTPRDFVARHLDAGRDVLVEIDAQGAAMIRENAAPAMKRAIADVMIVPPSFAELDRRLSGRGTESAEALAVRLANARTEMRRWREYKYVIVSGTKEQDVASFRAVLAAERLATARFEEEEKPS
jgi:guanylate kinase